MAAAALVAACSGAVAIETTRPAPRSHRRRRRAPSPLGRRLLTSPPSARRAWSGLESIDQPEDSFVWGAPAGDTTVEATSAMRSLRTTSSGTALLESVTLIDGEAFASVRNQIVDEFNMLEAVGGRALDSVRGRRQMSARAAIDPARLLPTYASFRDDIDVQSSGGNYQHTRAVQWEFDWPSSDCAT